MSSHHFVKEGQEPALFVLEAISAHVVMPLLEWSPTVLVAASALPQVLSWGIKIDMVVCDNHDTLPDLQSLADIQGPVRVMMKRPGESMLSSGIFFLKNSGENAVSITAASPAAHFDELSYPLENFDVAFVDENLKWVAAVSTKYEKWLPGGTKLSLRLVERSQPIAMSNAHETNGMVEVEESGLVKIQSDRLFWIGEPFS